MQNYQNAKIYKLTSQHTDWIYIGSTTKTLEERLRGHRYKHTQWRNGKAKYTTSFTLFELGPVNIELIKPYPCDTKQELEAEEGPYINTEANTLNKIHLGRTPAEYRQANRERRLAWALERIRCDVCLSMTTQAHIAQHKKTRRCISSSESTLETVDSELEELEDRLSRL